MPISYLTKIPFSIFSYLNDYILLCVLEIRTQGRFFGNEMHLYLGGLSKGSRESASVSHSVVSNSLRPHRLQPTRLLCPWGFSRQEYWSGLPCPFPGDLPDPGIEPESPALQGDSFLSEPQGKKDPKKCLD